MYIKHLAPNLRIQLLLIILSMLEMVLEAQKKRAEGEQSTKCNKKMSNPKQDTF